MKVSELIETLQQAIAEVPAYADAEVLVHDGAYRAAREYSVEGLGTQDGADEYSAREDVLYLMQAGGGEYARSGEIREWNV